MARLPQGLTVPLLAGLGDEDSVRFFELASLRTFHDGERIIVEGGAGDALYVIQEGAVRVEKRTIDRSQEVLSTLTSGECFGELSLIDRQPRSASVLAAGTANLFEFRQDDLDAFFDTHPHVHRLVLENLVKITSQRIRNLDEALVESTYDKVILVDGSFSVLRWRQLTGSYSLLGHGLGPESVNGRNLFDLLPGLGEGVRRKMSAVLDTGDMSTMALEYDRADGEVRYFELTIAPYTALAQAEGDGSSDLVLGLRDVTESRSLEAQLIDAEKLAMAGQMSAEIGHELNNYLAVIMGHTDLLLSDTGVCENPQATRSLDAISRQLHKIGGFVNSLMDLSVLRTERESADLNALVEGLVQFIQGQSRFRQVEFELDLQQPLPDLQVDPGQVQQVILNLYANAADAMEKGRVRTRSRFDSQANVVTVEVSDTGPGMPEEVVGKVFESGFTTKATGHGFGLAICARIVHNHNGEISVETVPGEGTTFTLRFPA